MERKKIENFTNTLLSWYSANGRHDLPWRKKNMTAYEVWVSEIMLQQTQVSRVKEYYRNFMKRFPNVSSLAETSWEEFLPYYQGLGYYARGRNMLKTARIISEEKNGRFPTEEKNLKKLPGVGPYTAKAICAFACDESVIAPDTNIKRIFSRYFHETNEQEAREKAEQFLRDLNISGKRINSALMDFGSLVCVARPVKEDHDCPFGRKCQCFRGVSEKKTTSKAQTFPYSEARAYVYLHENHQKYFSKTKTKFTSFRLPKGVTSREGIKKYFYDKYGLTLSVRPPFDKKTQEKEASIFVYAQILKGEHDFFTHEKSAVKNDRKTVK